jgi:negative regulator of flagellin synthesis FlgM
MAMSNKITGFGPTTTVISGGSRPGAVERPAGDSPAPGGASPAGDSVTLTDSARTLQKLSEAVAAVPVVDGARVESIKNQLAHNTYKVDSLKVAAKLLLADRELPKG